MKPLFKSSDLDALIDASGDKRIVMLGEASHGTHEYYVWRTAVSKRLIHEKGFDFIAVEGDWPDCYSINRYVKNYKDAGNDIEQVLKHFDRWPTWMWGNWEVAALAEWLHGYNKSFAANKKKGFYGLDVYSLWDSLKAMISYLEKESPGAAHYVKKAIQCFEPFNEDEQSYARAALYDPGCRDEVLRMLKEIRLNAQFMDGDREAGFNTEQNALIAVNAEKYYSNMIGFNNESWNIRDSHMMETLSRLLDFHGRDSKAIVWEHNTHIGDARATDMHKAGMINIGQLARETYGEDNVFLAGFAGYEGTVIAGRQWGALTEEMDVPPAKPGSIEAMLHDTGTRAGYILFKEEPAGKYTRAVGHRAIGVVYNPATERQANYVPSVLSGRYDALLFFDQTTALHPLHLHPDRHKLMAAYPFNV